MATAKPQAMSQGQLDQSQVRAPPSSLQRTPRPQGDLSDSFYFDPKLQPENFKVLNDLNSREIIRTPPQAGKGSYGDEVLIRLQSSASFLDRQQTNFKIQFENTSDKESGTAHHEYILADGGNVLLDNMEVEIGEQIAEKNEESARYYQHLLLATANQSHYEHEANALMKSGLSMVLDGAVDVYRRDLATSTENNINIQASYSNIEGIVAMVYKKDPSSDASNQLADSINYCPLPNLDEFGITIQTHELGTRGGTFGLEEAYANYRRHYNMLSSIGGQGMLDYHRYKKEHTPLCVNTDLLPDAPPEVLQNSLSTNDRGSQLNISLKVSNTDDVSDARLVVFVVHKRILQLKEGIAKIGI